ncbi:unnamed protein product [Durusdinium trenchii]|uniref:HTH myb-type domain-containing protein n=2 Tax=Durusdinium trenchii TaxID=1381693 RepID=A0ABP0N0U5_9DINO
MVATVDEVNEEAIRLLKDAKDVQQFCDAASRLGESAKEVPEAIQCVLLRLVARLAKVLRLLCSSPGPMLLNAASDWAQQVQKSPEHGLETLLEVRDVGLAEGVISSADVRTGVSLLLPKMLQAGQRICNFLAIKGKGGLETIELSDSQNSVGADAAGQAASSIAQTRKRPRPQPAQPAQPVQPPAAQVAQVAPSVDIFSEPLLSDLPKQPSQPVKKVRSAAPVSSDGDSFVAKDGPARPRRGYNVWTEAEEQRLIAGYKKYGKDWKMIRANCGLEHRDNVQIKDKWRVLQKNGTMSGNTT